MVSCCDPCPRPWNTGQRNLVHYRRKHLRNPVRDFSHAARIVLVCLSCGAPRPIACLLASQITPMPILVASSAHSRAFSPMVAEKSASLTDALINKRRDRMFPQYTTHHSSHQSTRFVTPVTCSITSSWVRIAILTTALHACETLGLRTYSKPATP